MDLGKRAAESNAFGRRCVCVGKWAYVVGKPEDLVG